ncbi:hypothetical protein Peur_010451 [Populus x canadensis]
MVLLGAGGVHKLATIVVEAAKVSPKEKRLKSSDQKIIWIRQATTSTMNTKTKSSSSSDASVSLDIVSKIE